MDLKKFIAKKMMNLSDKEIVKGTELKDFFEKHIDTIMKSTVLLEGQKMNMEDVPIINVASSLIDIMYRMKNPYIGSVEDRIKFVLNLAVLEEHARREGIPMEDFWKREAKKAKDAIFKPILKQLFTDDTQ
jgi:hypothetical protein